MFNHFWNIWYHGGHFKNDSGSRINPYFQGPQRSQNARSTKSWHFELTNTWLSSPTRRGPLTTISGFIPSYTHLQPWLNRVCRGYNYLITRGSPSCSQTLNIQNLQKTFLEIHWFGTPWQTSRFEQLLFMRSPPFHSLRVSFLAPWAQMMSTPAWRNVQLGDIDDITQYISIYSETNLR